jgi:uncharacterized protein (DUF4415 family)
MNEKRTTARTQKGDVPYNLKSKAATLKYWEGATAHTGVAELRAKRGRPAKTADERKEQIALRVDKEVLEWYRAQGTGWQTRMNAVLKAYRDATV